MIRWREGRVSAIVQRSEGLIELIVDTQDGSLRSLAYAELVGAPTVNDRVLLNCTALELGLGTGGFAFVVAIPDRLPPDEPRPGHIVKARYTPQQVTTLGVDEPDSAHHDLLREADDIDGMPVVVADLHSSLPAILIGLRSRRPDLRVAYVMTDGGALPLAFSRSVAQLGGAGWLAGSVTVGQAFGGDLEAVTVHSGLLAARHVLRVDVAIVTQGPGNLGTGTRWGFSGVATGESVNAASVLGGRPVAALRISEADPRPRHRGVSHHSLTALGRVALRPSDIAVPALPGEFGDEISLACQALSPPHRLIELPVDGLRAALSGSPVSLSTMGRSLDDDPSYFLGCAVAGVHAATLVS